jgi:hypothetical protein
LHQFVDKRVEIRRKQTFLTDLSDRVQYLDVSPKQIVGVSAALIPFLEQKNFKNIAVLHETTAYGTGFADALLMMGIKYNSEQAHKFAKRLIMNIRESAHMTSKDLGKEKGMGLLPHACEQLGDRELSGKILRKIKMTNLKI